MLYDQVSVVDRNTKINLKIFNAVVISFFEDIVSETITQQNK